MAIDAYMVFIPNSGSVPTSESQVDFGSGLRTADPFPTPSLTNQNFFEIYDWSFDTEQTFSFGSASGAGPGKITFNPLSVDRRIDLFSETLFINSAAGTAFKYVDLLLRRTSGGATVPSATYLAYRFGLCVVKTLDWSSDEESPRERVTFEYGSLSIAYAKQAPDGSYASPTIVGWDRLRNVRI